MWFLHRPDRVVDTAAFQDGDFDGDAGEQAAGAMSITGWLQDKADDSMIQDLLKSVIDPEIGVDIVNLGLVYGISVAADGTAHIRMTLTTPGCPLSGSMENAVHDVLWGAPGLSDVSLDIVWDPPWSTDMMTRQAKRELGWPV